MSTPEEEFPGSRSSHPEYVFRYTSHEEGDQFAPSVARRRFRAIVDDRDPKVYDGYGHLLHVDEAPGTLARLA